MRIVSLVPAGTEIVSFLGLADQLVGVSADSEAHAGVPVLNTISIDTSRMTSAEIDVAATAQSQGHSGASLYHVDPDKLRAAAPELILTQEICDVCAVSRKDVDLAATALGYRPTILSLSPVTLDQVLEDIQTVASATGIGERGSETVRDLRARIDAVRRRTSGLRRARVFCMEWLDPPYSAGHWVPEMVELAGGCDELGTAGGPSRRITWQEILDYAPEVIVLMPCSLDLARVADEFPTLQQLYGWQTVPAVQQRRVYAGDTHLFSCSGPRLVDGLEVLARILHPEAFPPLPRGRAIKLSLDGARLEPYA